MIDGLAARLLRAHEPPYLSPDSFATVPTMDIIRTVALTALCFGGSCVAYGEMEEVLVIGEQPGPALWRVSSGAHVLWLLGEVSQLPAKVTWHSKQLEAVLRNSQEVLLDGGSIWGPRTRE
jgi:hypothetical protein